METYANGATEDDMIDSLTFKLDSTANYVISRTSVTYNAQGSNIYESGTGSRVVRFVLSGTGQYLDPSTVRLTYTLSNKEGTKVLFPVGGPWSFFRRGRVYSGSGAVLEDIDYMNRIHEMVHLLTSKANRDNDLNVEGFGGYWDSDDVISSSDAAADAANAGGLRKRLKTAIIGGSKKTVSFKTLFGIFNQPKMIPLQFCPLTVEFELVTGVDDAIVSALDSSQFPTSNTSTSWRIEDVQIKADVIELDSAVHNGYVAHLDQGHPIPINYTSFITQLQAITNGTIAVNITRSCSRLKSIFVTFDKEDSRTTTQRAAASKSLIRKPWNHFYHPMKMISDGYKHDHELELQVLIGNKPYPIFPTRSGAEQYYQLKKSLGIHGSSFHSMSIDTLTKYMTDHFIVGIDTEKVLGAAFSGVNCRQDLITLKAKGAGTIDLADYPDKVYVTLQPDFIVEIRGSGVLVID